jgi:rhodanese-related sulfurtransferase
MRDGISRARSALAQGRVLAAALTGCVLASCTQVASTPSQTVYVTEYGLGPDKWATAWLLTRQLEPGAELRIVEPGAPHPAGAVPFDLLTAKIRREGNRSAFEVARGEARGADPVLDLMGEIVHEIEINFWSAGGPAESRAVEEAFRSLQYRYGRDAVTPQCYVAFFDRVHRVLQDARETSAPFSTERLQMSCDELTHLADTRGAVVPEIPIVDVLSAAAAGRKVVFVDVREADEFAEGHIPGALNIPIRDVTPAMRDRFAGAAYVVSYCVKDFRGFEMAKALSRVGVSHSVIMRPYGIKGWTALGLPVTGSKGLTERRADEALQDCLANTDGCLNDGGGGL